MWKIKKKDMGYLNGLMDNNIKVIGKMENNMAKELQFKKIKVKLKVNGLKERESDKIDHNIIISNTVSIS